jgi:uncharacterized tellurite resistance protein B-like protein
MDCVKTLEHQIINDKPQVSDYLFDINQETAERAFRNTSFSPEKRGESVRLEYAKSLLIDKIKVLDEIVRASKRGASIRPDYNAMVDEWFQSHRLKLRDCYTSWLYSHSKVASSFITGPANFPVARNQKLSGYADAKLLAIDEFREKSMKKLLKFVMPHGDGSSIQTDDPNASDKIEHKIAALEKQREDMKAINKMIRKYFKNDQIDISVECLSEFKKILVEQFDMDDEQIADLINPSYSGKVVGFETWQLQNLGANIKRYKQRLAQVEKINSATIDDAFSNGIRVTVSDDKKICIHFGFKPSDDIRTLLKENAFKFSRGRDCAWVRKFTLNAASSYFNCIKPKLVSLEA